MTTATARPSIAPSAPAAPAPVASKVIVMTPAKECRGSVRYACPEAQDGTAAVRDVYLMRHAYPHGMPAAIRVTIEPVSA